MILIFITIVIFALIDYSMVKNSKEPIFCFFPTTNLLDAQGTKVYQGLGYYIEDYTHYETGEKGPKIGIYFIYSPTNPFPYPPIILNEGDNETTQYQQNSIENNTIINTDNNIKLVE